MLKRIPFKSSDSRKTKSAPPGPAVTTETSVERFGFRLTSRDPCGNLMSWLHPPREPRRRFWSSGFTVQRKRDFPSSCFFKPPFRISLYDTAFRASITAISSLGWVENTLQINWKLQRSSTRDRPHKLSVWFSVASALQAEFGHFTLYFHLFLWQLAVMRQRPTDCVKPLLIVSLHTHRAALSLFDFLYELKCLETHFKQTIN